MKNESHEKVMKWLQSGPSLENLSAGFPELWEAVRHELAEIVAGGSVDELSAYINKMSQAKRFQDNKYHSNRGDKKITAASVHQAVRSRMVHLALKQHLVSEATGIEKGKVRFNLLNGFIAQKLLFSEGLERKPVSLFLFRIVWPLLWQRRLLMPLVQPEGIYCFYSRQLVNGLAELIGTRTCLEIAAGDGSLTRFLSDRRVKITATDDYSWKHEVKYPEFVVKMDAQSALREYAPEVVLCSWPPAGNTFEQKVFKTGSVHMYIVIGSSHQFAAGNWDTYRTQSSFEFGEEKRLSSLVLPPELNAAVYIFRRRGVEEKRIKTMYVPQGSPCSASPESMTRSTRRFLARPSLVALSAIGRNSA